MGSIFGEFFNSSFDEIYNEFFNPKSSDKQKKTDEKDNSEPNNGISVTTFSTYQKLSNRTNNPKLSKADRLLEGLLGLTGEAGECSDIVKKSLYQDGRPYKEALKEELGDVLWYVAELCTALDINMEDVAAENIVKLSMRYPHGFDSDKSLNR